MGVKLARGIWQSALFTLRREILHGSSTREMGDMRKEEVRKRFLKQHMGISNNPVLMEQVHGSRVISLSKGQARRRADAMIYIQEKIPDKSRRYPLLTILTADCVPLLFYDPKTSFIGVAHAGWKGTIKEISKQVACAMAYQGSSPRNILVAIGPSICGRCYEVDDARASLFKNVFGSTNGVMIARERRYYIDLKKANALQLLDAGISKRNIDMSSYCTMCSADNFFSYRRDTRVRFGKMLTYIGFQYTHE